MEKAIGNVGYHAHDHDPSWSLNMTTLYSTSFRNASSLIAFTSLHPCSILLARLTAGLYTNNYFALNRFDHRLFIGPPISSIFDLYSSGVLCASPNVQASDSLTTSRPTIVTTLSSASLSSSASPPFHFATRSNRYGTLR
mmetsp:Transcript_14661/g.40497  ORF Transcript_14661/g.40497 Transcript_14661/m.40497 type:complete len:140 (-) Transcript_14661:881-1300(-)